MRFGGRVAVGRAGLAIFFARAVIGDPSRSSIPGKDVEPMKYALLIYAAEKDWAEKSKEEQGRIYNEYWAYSVELKKSGKMVSCEPLDPTSTATTIRVRDGKTVPTDGPFADTKEQLGGIYVVEVKDLDEAMAWAARIPDARTGCIEIRPLMNVPEM
jgi:hypothetical protein